MDELKTKTQEKSSLNLSGSKEPREIAPYKQEYSSDRGLYKFRLIIGTLIGVMILALIIKNVLLGIVSFGAVIFVYGVMTLVKKSQALAIQKHSSELSPSKNLKNILFADQYLENVDNLGEKLFSQYELLNEKFAFYVKLLGSKFSPSEITYQRYFSAVENIYQALNDNFLKLHNSLNILSKVSIKDLRQQLEITSDVKQKHSLQEQINSFELGLEKTKELLELNQKAIFELEKLSFSLNDIKNSQTASEEDLKVMMKDLKELADRAHKYSL